MRVTEKTLYEMIGRSLSRSTERLAKIQRTISSGKRVNEPADDPMAMIRILDYRAEIAAMDQYSENIHQGTAWLRRTESALYDITQLVGGIKETIVSQTSSTATGESREFAAEEISVIFDRVIQLANTRVGDRYIFAGFKTDSAPFLSSADYAYRGDTGKIEIDVARDLKATINLNGSEVFTGGPVNVLETFDNVVTHLRNNDVSQLQGDLDALDSSLSHLLGKLTEVGAKTSQLESTEDSLQDLKLNLTEMVADLEDVDLAQAVTELSLQETVYQASLASSVRLMQTSLLDFLR